MLGGALFCAQECSFSLKILIHRKVTFFHASLPTTKEAESCRPNVSLMSLIIDQHEVCLHQFKERLREEHCAAVYKNGALSSRPDSLSCCPVPE